MKSIIYSLSILMICIFFFTLCTKDNEYKEKNYTFHVIGSKITDRFYYKDYEPPLVLDASNSDSDFMSDSIDLDGDGYEDILFESMLFISDGGYSKTAQATILSEKLQFTYEWIADTVYLCSYELGDTLYMCYYNYFPNTCDSSAVIDTIDRSRSERSVMELGDTIFFSESESFFLSSRGSGWRLGSKDSIMQVMGEGGNILGYRFYFNHYGIWSGLGARYLAFRIEENSYIKYGWILLEVKENMIIKIYEVVCFIKE